MNLNHITDILSDIRCGKMVILVDDEDRENEGDLVMAAEYVSAQAINFMATHGRGLICLSLSEQHCQRLGLSMMVDDNRTLHQTAFTVSIEAATGVTTGISAHDRAHTIYVASRKNATAEDIIQPGHIFPLKAHSGGVLKRAGHTEASVDLARLTGLPEAAVICEILNDNGTMARLPDLQQFAKKHQIKIGSIADLIEYRIATEMLVESIGYRPVIIDGNTFNMHMFYDKTDDLIHYAFTHGTTTPEATFSSNPQHDTPILVRVHQPLSSFDFMDFPGLIDTDFPVHYHWKKCLQAIHQSAAGVAVGLHAPVDENKKALRLSKHWKNVEISDTKKTGHNTPSASNISSKEQKWDSRIYGTGAQILRSLGVEKMRLINAPIHLSNLKGFNLEIVGFETLN